MQVTVNGEARELVEGMTVSDLLGTLSLAEERIAIELNKTVLRRRDWASTRLTEDDRVEVVHFVGGG